MISLKKIKRNTQFVVLSVIVLTLLTMNLSYSYFFAVKSKSTVESLTAGTLAVSIDSSTKMKATQLMPSTAADLPTSETSIHKDDSNNSYATITLQNTGTINAKFTASISLDTSSLPSGKTASNCVDLKYIVLGIYDEKNNKWVNLSGSTSSKVYTATIGSFSSSNGSYPVLTDSVAASSSRNYRFYIWLSESTPVTEIGKYVYLKLNVNSCVEGQC